MIKLQIYYSNLYVLLLVRFIFHLEIEIQFVIASIYVNPLRKKSDERCLNIVGNQQTYFYSTEFSISCLKAALFTGFYGFILTRTAYPS